MKTRVQLLEDAMELLNGAFNCHRAAKLEGQEWVGGYIQPHKQHARAALIAARQLAAPRLP